MTVLSQSPVECPQCLKPMPLCICDSVTAIENRLALLILQHPQEQDRTLGTARLAMAHLSKAVLRVGLSWPSLAKAYGHPVRDPARWAVLYLGSAAAQQGSDADIIPLTRKGEAADNPGRILSEIEGVVLLDGTWSQAKALWWRNPWMLKCQRIILNPATRS
ncbi:MAG: DTW domain-containing protein, partial [Alphaproteobacteria bacterium]|nr:DTW domain-containing protein [Alphaproteobacteria bacterium]